MSEAIESMVPLLVETFTLAMEHRKRDIAKLAVEELKKIKEKQNDIAWIYEGEDTRVASRLTVLMTYYGQLLSKACMEREQNFEYCRVYTAISMASIYSLASELTIEYMKEEYGGEGDGEVGGEEDIPT
ncbi:MAG: hypothetical protein GXO68_05680 [Crenarchaeota archaeon]|nr:hypothetical protein [Thermoproteota archaeon]